MSQLEFVLDRLNSGAKIRIGIDYFGRKRVEVGRRWLPGLARVDLRPVEVEQVEAALAERRRRRAQPVEKRPRLMGLL